MRNLRYKLYQEKDDYMRISMLEEQKLHVQLDTDYWLFSEKNVVVFITPLDNALTCIRQSAEGVMAQW